MSGIKIFVSVVLDTAGECPEVLRKEPGAVAINMAADGPTSCQHYLFWCHK